MTRMFCRHKNPNLWEILFELAIARQRGFPQWPLTWQARIITYVGLLFRLAGRLEPSRHVGGRRNRACLKQSTLATRIQPRNSGAGALFFKESINDQEQTGLS